MSFKDRLQAHGDIQTLRLIAQAFVDTVRDSHPLPCPTSPMYMAYEQAGGTLESFNSFIDALVRNDRLRRNGHSLTLGPKELN